jgi:hypothetical protein
LRGCVGRQAQRELSHSSLGLLLGVTLGWRRLWLRFFYDGRGVAGAPSARALACRRLELLWFPHHAHWLVGGCGSGATGDGAGAGRWACSAQEATRVSWRCRTRSTE